jgi:hypothetical protein
VKSSNRSFGVVVLLGPLQCRNVQRGYKQERIQVLWDLKLIQFLGTSLRKRIQNSEYKIRYESEYLFSAPHRAVEGARASEGALKLKLL